MHEGGEVARAPDGEQHPVVYEGPAHLIQMRDETAVLPGAWTAERHLVDKPAALPCPTLPALLGEGK